MAWPPSIYPPDRNNDTVQLTNHPGDHNQLSAAVTEIITKVNAVDAAKMPVGGTTTEPVIFGPSGQQVNLNNGGITTDSNVVVGGSLRLDDTGDVSLSSTAHALQIGTSSTVNIAVDSNEIQARNNGAAATLALNASGGTVSHGGSITVADNVSVVGGASIAAGKIDLFEDGSADFDQTLRARALISETNTTTTGNVTAGGYVLATGNVRAENNVIAGGANAVSAAQGSQMSDTGIIRTVCGSDALNLGNAILNRGGAGADDAGQPFISFRRGLPWTSDALIGAIRIATASTVSYGTTSDKRLKVQTNNASDALDLVEQLGSMVYRGRWIADEGQGDEWIFLNSQDAQPLVPFAVSGPPDGDPQQNPQQIDHSALVPLLLAAVDQLAARVAELESA